LALCYPLCANLNTRLAEGFNQCSSINTTQAGNLAREGIWSNSFTLCLVITTLCLELHPTKGHDTGSQHVAVKLFLFRETKNIEGIFSVLQLLIVINRGNSGLALRHISVVIDVSTQTALLSETSSNIITIGLEQLIENMVGSFDLLLLSNTRLLQQIRYNITTGSCQTFCCR